MLTPVPKCLGLSCVLEIFIWVKLKPTLGPLQTEGIFHILQHPPYL